MTVATRERLFGYQQAFDHPVSLWITVVLAALLVIAPVIVVLLRQLGKIGQPQYVELMKRIGSWAILVPLMAGPVLLGAGWMMVAVALLSILCVREFSTAPGMPRDRVLEGVVYLGIGLLTFAALDNWFGFFVALIPLAVSVIAAVAILEDRPQGYIQRVSLAAFAFLFFGVALAHLGFMGNSPDYRPAVMLILVAVEANDIFAYCCGKTFGHRKLIVRTSPNKTIGGALGALVLTTTLVAVVGHYVFAGTPIDVPSRLILLGLLVSVAGQLGDLMLSSVKRDLGIKDLGAILPGHGGLLDRFDSLVLVAPVVFHFIHYYQHWGAGEQTRIFSG